MSMETLNYPFFDGEKVIEDASVTVKDRQAAAVSETFDDRRSLLLLPGFVDAHTHIDSEVQVETMLKHGIMAACDISASPSLINKVKPFTIVTSAGMTMGTLNGRGYVREAIAGGAQYIKVLLMGPFMPKPVMWALCDEAHEHGLKVAVHATTVRAQKMSVEAGADILIHIPLEAQYPRSLAETIAAQGIVSIPTLVMMENFCKKPEDMVNAMNAVKILYDCGVTILVGTDANPGSFAPAVSYGDSFHREMQLLVRAGMKPLDVLSGATKKAADVFGFQIQGLQLISGRPDQEISDSRKMKQFWI